MREKKPMKIPYNISFIGSQDFDLKIKLIKDIFRFIRQNEGRQISIVLNLSLEIKK